MPQPNLYFQLVEDILQNPDMKLTRGFIQHGDISVYTHCVMVSLICYIIAKRFKRMDLRSLTRGALLHDFFLYDWHHKGNDRLHGFHHPKVALQNADKRFLLGHIERDIIRKHMWPLTITKIPKTKESWLVNIVDKVCSLLETCKFKGYSNAFVDEYLSEHIRWSATDAA